MKHCVIVLDPTDSSPGALRQRKRIASVSIPHSTRVFDCLPLSHLGTRAPPEVWQSMIALRLGNPLFSGTQPCNFCRTANYRHIPTLDTFGHHAAVCPCADGSVHRHNSLRDHLISELSSFAIGLRPPREWSFPQDASNPPEARRRLDVYIEDSQFRPRPVGFDVTLISPHSAPYCSNSSCDPLTALYLAEDTKDRKYRAL